MPLTIMATQGKSPHGEERAVGFGRGRTQQGQKMKKHNTSCRVVTQQISNHKSAWLKDGCSTQLIVSLSLEYFTQRPWRTGSLSPPHQLPWVCRAWSLVLLWAVPAEGKAQQQQKGLKWLSPQGKHSYTLNSWNVWFSYAVCSHLPVFPQWGGSKWFSRKIIKPWAFSEGACGRHTITSLSYFLPVDWMSNSFSTVRPHIQDDLLLSPPFLCGYLWN